MFVEIENVFCTARTVINLDLVTEINEKNNWVRTADGKKYDVVHRSIKKMLQIVEPMRCF